MYDPSGKIVLQSPDGSNRFEQLHLFEAKFSGTDMEGASFDSRNLVRADFTNTDLYWAKFYDVNCPAGSSFRGTSLRGCFFYNCNFADADFTDADVSRDNLNGTASFEGINFYRATFLGANLSSAEFAGVNFAGATYDSCTLFPENFSPDAAGMIRVERTDE